MDHLKGTDWILTSLPRTMTHFYNSMRGSMQTEIRFCPEISSNHMSRMYNKILHFYDGHSQP